MKPKLGDIFSFETKRGTAYMQLVKGSKNNNDLERVRMFYDLYEKQESLQKVVEGEHFYMDFPITLAHRAKDLKISYEDFIPLSSTFELPRYYRSENIFGKGWVIHDVQGKVTIVEELTEEQKKLSPYSTGWTMEMLKEKLEGGWRVETWKLGDDD